MSEAQAEEARRLAENLERRQGDARLVEALRHHDFAGCAYQGFETELARYGLSVLRGWMYAGTVFRLLASRGFLLQPTDRELETLHTDPDVRADLAHATVGKAMPQFRRQALVEGGWRVDGGANLTTYLVGSLLYTFPNEYRAWRAQRKKWARQDRGDYTANGLDRGPCDDPAARTAGNLWVIEQMEAATEREREIVMLTLAGYEQAAIAELVGEKSTRTVEAVLYRWRTRLKRTHTAMGGNDAPA